MSVLMPLRRLTVLAVQEVADGFAAVFVGLGFGFALLGGEPRTACGGVLVFGLTTGGAAVGKAGLVGLQLELFAADCAGSNGEGHGLILPRGRGVEGVVA